MGKNTARKFGKGVKFWFMRPAVAVSLKLVATGSLRRNGLSTPHPPERLVTTAASSHAYYDKNDDFW